MLTVCRGAICGSRIKREEENKYSYIEKPERDFNGTPVARERRGFGKTETFFARKNIYFPLFSHAMNKTFGIKTRENLFLMTHIRLFLIIKKWHFCQAKRVK